MLRDNAEIVAATFNAWNAGDMGAYRDLLHPDVIMRAPEGWVEPGPFVGREAVMRQFQQLRDTWDSDHLEQTSDIVAVGDRVAVRYLWHGVGHGPGSKVEATWLFTVRRGKVFHIEYFWDHPEALEALGVRR